MPKRLSSGAKPVVDPRHMTGYDSLNNGKSYESGIAATENIIINELSVEFECSPVSRVREKALQPRADRAR